MFTTAWLLRLLGAWLTSSSAPSTLDLPEHGGDPMPPWPK
jgi:hypothetical protein